MGQGRLTPALYDEDPSLKNYLAKVPFGLSENPPMHPGKGMREKFGFTKEDTVLLWGGGIWNWFDPLTLIQAVAMMDASVKLVFMGIKHPNKEIKEMEMTGRAIALAEKLGVRDTQVFFNFGWVPYNERQGYLLEADIGVSTHFDHLETRYAFRTRMLDYLWAALPVICTEGDYFAERFSKEGVGVAVAYADSEAIVQAIKKIQADPRRFKENAQRLALEFTWAKVTAPLLSMIDRLAKRAKGGFSPKLFWNMFKTGVKLKNPFYSRVI